MAHPQKVATCLWFDGHAEEAARLYCSLVPGSRISGLSHYGKRAPMPEGTVLLVSFELAGTPFMALNGGPGYKHSEAASIVIECETQHEIDRLWAGLLEGGGREQRCGWLKDRYGVSWQIVPSRIGAMMQDPDHARRDRVMAAIMGMIKLDLAALEAAYRG